MRSDPRHPYIYRASTDALIGERKRANLIVQRARIFCYLSRAMPYRKPSTRFQINATHDISHKFTTCTYRHTVIVLAVVQLLQSKMRQTRRAVSPPLLAVLLLRARKPIQTAGENTCSQKRASCLGNSRREREAFSSMLSAARSTREARYEQMCHLLSHQRRLEAETPAMRRGKHV